MQIIYEPGDLVKTDDSIYDNDEAVARAEFLDTEDGPIKLIAKLPDGWWKCSDTYGNEGEMSESYMKPY